MPPKVKLPPDQLEPALEALRQATGLEARMLLAAPGGNGRPADVVLEFRLEGREYRVAVHAETALDRVEALRLVKDRLDEPGLLFAPYITDVIARKCRELDVPFIDAVGNAYLRFPGLYVFITGQKPKHGIATATVVRGVGMATTLRVVFALLCRPQLLNVPYREITDVTGVALGAVGPVFQDLYKLGYLNAGRPKRGRRPATRQPKQNRRILDPVRLFEEWVTNYPVKLRPTLNPRRFRAQDADWWKTAQLNELGAVWGGEVAADHLTKLPPTGHRYDIRPTRVGSKPADPVGREAPVGRRPPRAISTFSKSSGGSPPIHRYPTSPPRFLSTPTSLQLSSRGTWKRPNWSGKNTLTMLSVRSDRPIQPAALTVIRAVDKVTKELGLTYFVAGAMARDILLTHVFRSHRTPRHPGRGLRGRSERLESVRGDQNPPGRRLSVRPRQSDDASTPRDWIPCGHHPVQGR